MIISNIPTSCEWIHEPVTSEDQVPQPYQKVRGESAEDVEYTNCIAAKTHTSNVWPRHDTPPTCVLDMTLNHLMLRFQSWNFEECGVPLHCHYSQVHADPE